MRMPWRKTLRFCYLNQVADSDHRAPPGTVVPETQHDFLISHEENRMGVRLQEPLCSFINECTTMEL